MESNKLTQVHLCPDSEPNKLFQVIQLLLRLKYTKIENLPVLSFSSASAMVHNGSSEIYKRIFLGSTYRMSQHLCVPGRTPTNSHESGGSAGLAGSQTLNSWYTHITLLPLMYIQSFYYLLQVSLLFFTAQLQFNSFFKVLVILSGDLAYGIIFNFPFFSILVKLLRYINSHRDFLFFRQFM